MLGGSTSELPAMCALPQLSGRASFEMTEIDGAVLIHLCKPDPILSHILRGGHR